MHKYVCVIVELMQQSISQLTNSSASRITKSLVWSCAQISTLQM